MKSNSKTKQAPCPQITNQSLISKNRFKKPVALSPKCHLFPNTGDPSVQRGRSQWGEGGSGSSGTCLGLPECEDSRFRIAWALRIQDWGRLGKMILKALALAA